MTIFYEIIFKPRTHSTQLDNHHDIYLISSRWISLWW